MKPSAESRGRRRRRATLTGRYERLIRACEALKENRPNSDKTWVEKTLRAYCDRYARVQRDRRSLDPFVRFSLKNDAGAGSKAVLGYFGARPIAARSF